MGSGYNDECDITRNLSQMLREFGRSSEWIFLTTNEQARNIEGGKVIDPQYLGFARRVERITQ
jgi:hypothetical protein